MLGMPAQAWEPEVPSPVPPDEGQAPGYGRVAQKIRLLSDVEIREKQTYISTELSL